MFIDKNAMNKEFCQAQLNGNKKEAETTITLFCDGAGKTLKNQGDMTMKH